MNVNGFKVDVETMEDGSYAVGLCNTDGYGTMPQSYFRWGDEKEKPYYFDFARSGLKGSWKLRDVWRQIFLGTFNGSFETNIPYHEVVMLRMYPVK